MLAAPADQAGMIGRPLDTVPLLSAVAEKVIGSDQSGRDRFRSQTATAQSASSTSCAFPARNRAWSSASMRANVTAAINREIRTAYLQLLFVCLFVLLGALVAGGEADHPARSR